MSLRVVADALDAELTRRVEAQNHLADALVELERHPGNRLLAIRGPDRHDGREMGDRPGPPPPACGPTSRRIAPSWPPPVPCAPGGRGPASASGRSCTSCSSPGPWRHRRSRWANWPPGWRAGSARWPTSWRRRRPCISPRWPGSARSSSGYATRRAAGANCWTPTTRTPRCSPALATAVDERLATCTNDPLSLPARLPRDLADGLDDGLDAIEARLAELATVRDGWADRRRAVADAVAALDPLWAREAQARDEALARVAVVLPPASDPRPALHRRLAALPMSPAAGRRPRRPARPRRRRVRRGGRAAPRRRAGDGGDRPPGRARRTVRGLPGEGACDSGCPTIRPSSRWRRRSAPCSSAPRTDLQALTPALVAYQQRVNGVERRPA